MRQVQPYKTRKWKREMAIKILTGATDLKMKNFSRKNSLNPNPSISPGTKKPGDPPPKKKDTATIIVKPAKKEKKV